MGTLLRNIRPIVGSVGTISPRFADGIIIDVVDGTTAETREDELIEGHDRLAFSGFTNAHTHLAMVLFRGLADDVALRAWLEDHVWPIERTLRQEDVYWCTLLALAEAIRGGTTCLADMYFHTDAVGRAIEESGLRALISYGIVADSLDAVGRAELTTARRIVERWNGAGDGRIRAAVSPHAVYTCGEDVWREAAALACDLDVPIHTHLAETRGEVDEWRGRTGESPVAYLDRIGALEAPTVAAHCVHVDRADVAILAQRGVNVVHCPKSNAKLGSGIAPIVAMREAGVTVALGTDGAASNNRLDMIEELRAAWMMQRAHAEDPRALSGREAVSMATDAGRSALGMPEGDLTIGAPADIVLVETTGSHMRPQHDPMSALAYAANTGDVTDVVVAGRTLMRDRELLTIDEERVQSEVERLLRRHRA